jgi:hypothetical protein
VNVDWKMVAYVTFRDQVSRASMLLGPNVCSKTGLTGYSAVLTSLARCFMGMGYIILSVDRLSHPIFAIPS